MNTIDRRRGALVGLAVGDALGAAVEFRKPGTFQSVTGYRGGGPHGLNAGEWTDDTSMALALADSIGAVGWDLNDQARRYLRWWRDGEYSVTGRCFDIGLTTVAALDRFEKQQDALASGDPSARASGNGSIMRLAPVPIRYADLFPDRLEELGRLAVESSLPTHASPQCLSACRYMTLVLCGLLQGLDREEVLSPTWEPVRALQDLEPWHPEVAEVAAGSFRRRQPPEIRAPATSLPVSKRRCGRFIRRTTSRWLSCVPLTWATMPTLPVRCAVNSRVRIGASPEFRRCGVTDWPGRT